MRKGMLHEVATEQKVSPTQLSHPCYVCYVVCVE